MATKAIMRKIRPTLPDILSARKFLAGHFAPTRLVEAASVSRVAGRRVFLKLGMELPTGSFGEKQSCETCADCGSRAAVVEKGSEDLAAAWKAAEEYSQTTGAYF